MENQAGDRRAPTGFIWDNDYGNLEQVRPFLAEFEQLKRALVEAGQYPYNDSFKGKIPALAESEREDTAIFLLQRLSREEQRQADLAALRADGFEEVSARPPGDFEYRGGDGEYHQERFAEIVVSNEHGTSRYETARVLWSRKMNGQPYVIMPKGKRTRGRLIETGSTVLARN